MDYNLQGLSTRSFEQLIQAVALEVIGPGTTIFGDGRDGGREATFEGSTNYSAHGEEWAGYIVLQAKFRQRLHDTDTDARWALDQLREELDSFASAQDGRRSPEYYLFITNVVLTPTQESGSKDKAFALLNEYKARLQMKDFDIWDYDKIRAYLDAHQDIRRAYAAWITPGDVLSQVLENIRVQTADFDKIITNFLQKELLDDQYAALEQAGHANSENQIPLARVFVDLPAFEQTQPGPPNDVTPEGELSPGFIADILEQARTRLNQLSTSPNVPISSQQALTSDGGARNGRFVLVGGPGQGKSTVCQFVCQLFRAALLKDRGTRFTPEVNTALRNILDLCNTEQFSLPSARRFPIRIVLRDFAKALSENDGIDSILGYIVERVHRRTGAFVLVDDFRLWLKEYPWVIILDGLDEVPASSNRGDVLKAIKDFWIDANDSDSDILAIATTRPQGYNEDFSPEFYQHRWLAPLSTQRAMHYARQLVAVRYQGNEERQDKVVTRLQKAAEDEGTVRLMRSPLQVTIMAALVDRVGQPPRERWNLFQQYYESIYEREREKETGSVVILRDYKKDVDSIHKQVGLLLQTEVEHSGGSEARLSPERLAGIIEAHLSSEGHQGHELQELQESILRAATDRLVFLVGLEQQAVGFEIRSLQEFMAAEGLTDGSDTTVVRRLEQIAPVLSWRNVYLFAVGKCFQMRDWLRKDLLASCELLNQRDDLSHIALAGSQLALDILEDGSIRKQPKFLKAFARQALQLLDLPSSEFGTRLAAVFLQHEPAELEDIVYEEIERRLSNTLPVRSAGAWYCLEALIGTGAERALELGGRYWPEDPEQQLQILPADSDSPAWEWIMRHLAVSLPSIDPIHVAKSEVHSTFLQASYEEHYAWLDAALSFFSRSPLTTHARLALFEQEPNLFSLTFLATPKHGAYITALKNIPLGNPAWKPLVSVVRFSDQPSSKVLARELRNLAEDYRSDLIGLAGWGAPWPLSACLRSTESADDLVRLAELVDSGSLGDVDDWYSAEVRWTKRGVTDSDLYYIDKIGLPFDKNIAERGFPLFSSGSSVTYGRGIPDNTRGLIEIYKNLSRVAVRTHIVNFILFSIETLIEDTSVTEEDSAQALHADLNFEEGLITSMLSDLVSMRRYIRAAEVEAILLLTNRGNEQLSLLDTLGRNASPPDRSRLAAASTHTLYKLLTLRPSSAGLIRMLALLSRSTDIDPSMASLLSAELTHAERDDDPNIREAAILFRLKHMNWTSDTIQDLVRYVAEFPTHLDALIDAVRERTQVQRIPEHIAAPVIALLYQHVSKSDREACEEVLSTIMNYFGLRTSCLNDLNVWSDSLGLPPTLFRFLHG